VEKDQDLYEFVVDYHKSPYDMWREAKFDWDNGFSPNTIPISRKGKFNITATLLPYSRYQDMAVRGSVEYGDMVELLGFAVRYPDIQRGDAVVALGSPLGKYGSTKRYLAIHGDAKERTAGLTSNPYEWFCRYLCITARKVVRE